MYRTFVQDLHNAHRRLECVLTLLRLQVDAIRSKNEPAVYRFLSNAVSYMHNFPRLSHHACEELCVKLTKQHNSFNEQEVELLLNLRRAQAGESKAPGEIKRIGTTYCELHADHIKREEVDALPLAKSLLGDDEWETIIGKSRLVRDPFDMADKLKSYEALYNYLTASSDEQSLN